MRLLSSPLPRPRALPSSKHPLTFLRVFSAAPIAPTHTLTDPLAHPSIRALESRLDARFPTFRSRGDEMQLLAEPTEFYRLLRDTIKTAQKHIFISTLYIGPEQSELVAALHSRLSSVPSLRLTIISDLNRSIREAPAHCAASLLAPLARDFPDRVDIWMYRPNTVLDGPLGQIVPKRMSEGWGTMHAKVYGVDDTVIMSGANLNTSYFTDRQDRYLHIPRHPSLARYLRAFLAHLTRFSHRVTSTSSPTNTSSTFSTPSNPVPFDLTWPHAYPPTRFSLIARDATRAFTAAAREAEHAHMGESDADTVVRPVMQSGPWGVREEEEAVGELLRAADEVEGGRTDITSGYFSLADLYKRRVLEGRGRLSIIAAAPEANGFLGSKGISGRIPEGYTHLERKFWTSVRKLGRDGPDGIELREWMRPGWTYHCKGIWLSPPGDGDPYLTLLGSSNLSGRSSNLDLELSLLISTRSEALRQRLGEEVRRLGEWSERVDERTFEKPERSVSWGSRALLKLGVQGML